MADMTSSLKKEKITRSLEQRLGRLRGGLSLKEGEHLLDICLYRNKTKVRQVVTDDMNERHILLPSAFTAKTIKDDIRAGAWMNDANGKPQYVGSGIALSKFGGGTVVLTRKRAIPLMAKNVLEFVGIVKGGEFNPATDEE